MLLRVLRTCIIFAFLSVFWFVGVVADGEGTVGGVVDFEEMLKIFANSSNACECRALILNGLFGCGFFNAAIRSLAASTTASFDVIPGI